MIYRLIEFFSAAVVLIPVFLLLWKIRLHSFQKTAFYFAFAIYLSAVYNLVGLPTVQFFTFEVNLNPIPFHGIIADLKNAILNVLLFMPLGLLLPLLWEKYRVMKNTLLFGLGMTFAIELLQLFTYRATDINDILTNFFGTALGYVLFRTVIRIAPNICKPEKNTKDIGLLFAIVTANMFFLQPLIVSYMIIYI